MRRLWQNGYLKEYYSELTEIVKEYLGGRYEFGALEMTSEELLDCRARWNVDDESYRTVRRMLTGGDLVKFAKFKPDSHENDRHLEAAFALVAATKPMETGVYASAAAGESVGAVADAVTPREGK